MRYFSTFSGIAGFELGIQQAYESNLKQQHIGEESQEEERPQGREWPADKRQKILRSPDGSAPLCVGYSEIDKYAVQIYQRHFPTHRNFGDITKINADSLPDFDLICGGFPCQAFSIAGKRGGFDDTRGTLFFDIARIVKAKRPRLLLLENVKGLLSHDGGRTFDTIIRTIDELGYDIQWEVLNSKNFGVPQNRERVLIVGHLRGTPRPKVFPIREESGLSIESIRTGKAKGGIATAITTNLKRGVHSGGETYAIQKINNEDGEESFTLTGQNKHGIYDGMKIRRLTPTECERLQGFPDGWTEKGIDKDGKEVIISDSQRYKVLGNAVTACVIKEIALRLPKIKK